MLAGAVLWDSEFSSAPYAGLLLEGKRVGVLLRCDIPPAEGGHWARLRTTSHAQPMMVLAIDSADGQYPMGRWNCLLYV